MFIVPALACHSLFTDTIIQSEAKNLSFFTHLIWNPQLQKTGAGVPLELFFAAHVAGSFAHDLIVRRPPRQPAFLGGQLQRFFAVEFGLVH